MNKMKYTLPLLLWAALFTACTQDEADIPQSHFLLELTASMAESNTRATSDGTWKGGEKVAVLATNHNGGGATYTYTASTTGELTPEDITKAHYWATGEVSKSVWALYYEDETADNVAWNGSSSFSGTWSVQSNQTGDGYQKSDLLWAVKSTVNAGNQANLTFRHQVAKVVIHIIDNDFTQAEKDKFKGVSIIDYPLSGTWSIIALDLLDLNWVHSESDKGDIIPYNLGPQKITRNGKEITTFTSYEALVLPGEVIYNKKIFKFSFDGYAPFYYTHSNDLISWGYGDVYTYCIEINSTGAVTVGSVTQGNWGNGGSYDLSTQ